MPLLSQVVKIKRGLSNLKPTIDMKWVDLQEWYWIGRVECPGGLWETNTPSVRQLQVLRARGRRIQAPRFSSLVQPQCMLRESGRRVLGCREREQQLESSGCQVEPNCCTRWHGTSLLRGGVHNWNDRTTRTCPARRGCVQAPLTFRFSWPHLMVGT